MARSVVFLLLFVGFCFAATPPIPSSCTGFPNTLPVSESLALLRNVTGGRLFRAGTVEPPLLVAVMAGTAYERGFAQGALLKKEVGFVVNGGLVWIERMIESYVEKLPKWFVDAIAKLGINAALDLTYELLKPWTPKHFEQEIEGLAAGSGMDMKTVRRLNLLPEIIQAACSMAGAWGKALNTPNNLIQLRSLDWNTDSPFQNYPVVFVHQPSDGGHPFATLGWAGFIGGMTGFSSAPIAVCEKVWIHYKGKKPRYGYPWHFLLRDILQFDADIDQALARIGSAQRTCSIFVGLGDHTNTFRAVEYSHDDVEVFNSFNFPDWGPAHPRFEDAIYVDKHTQPSGNPCLGDLFTAWHGQLNAESMSRYIAPIHETGDMHIAVADFANMEWWISNASPVNGNASAVVPAYKRAFTRVKLQPLFELAL